ncbi:MAG TPA: Hsp20/alpha crystallin family protein [Steroidobacteraceae bacterium]|nr:Hsp20/alpha crystallin family protein [Steroidobacteraceae bacterium]
MVLHPCGTERPGAIRAPRSAPARGPQAPLMVIEDGDREYLLSIDARDLDGDLLWYTYDDGFLTIGCEEPEESATGGGLHHSWRTFLLLEHVDSAAIHTEPKGHRLLIHVPKSSGGEHWR